MVVLTQQLVDALKAALEPAGDLRGATRRGKIRDAIATAEREAMSPLRKGSSRKAISANIRELEHSKTKAGKQRTHKQNIAIAMKKAGKTRKKR